MRGFEFTANQKLALWILIGLSAIGLAVVYGKHGRGTDGEVVLREPGNQAVVYDSDRIPISKAGSSDVVFHVTGRVRNPDVYELPRGSRVRDAIEVAGGAAEGADLEALNLAARIEDGARLHVPPAVLGPAGISTARGERKASAPRSDASRSPTGGKLNKPGEGLVHINSATSDELQRLPGVGPVIAKRIVEYRRRVGRFVKPEQLMDVKGIGPKTFEKMRPFVTL